MKKFLGALCSILTGGLAFLWLSLTNIKWTATVGSKSEVLSESTGWEMLSNSEDTFYKVMAIMTIVFASLLILLGIVLLLQSLGAVKIKANLNLVNNCLLLAYVVVAILLLVSIFNVGGTDSATLFGTKLSSKVAPAVGPWLNVAVSAVLAVFALLFAKPATAKRKRR